MYMAIKVIYNRMVADVLLWTNLGCVLWYIFNIVLMLVTEKRVKISECYYYIQIVVAVCLISYVLFLSCIYY